MRQATITRELTGAWDVWTITIPDDAPEDPERLKLWLENNYSLWDMCDMHDNDYQEAIITDVDDIDRKPTPRIPDWWDGVYQELLKNNKELIEKLAETYGEK